MRRPPPRSTRTDTLFPSPTLCRSPRDRSGRRREQPALGRRVSDAAAAAKPAIGTFERYLSLWVAACIVVGIALGYRSEEHTSELQSLMRISYAVFCLKKKQNTKLYTTTASHTTT